MSKGDISALAPNQYGTCQTEGPTTSYNDATLPPAGQGFFYLVQAQNFDCGLGTLGTTSAEQQRTNSNPGGCHGVIVTGFHASSEATVSGTVGGTLSNTQSSNNVYGSLAEVL